MPIRSPAHPVALVPALAAIALALCGGEGPATAHVLTAVANAPRPSTVDPVYRTFKDFVVGCDNSGSCTAIGVPAQGENDLVLVLRRDAGPSATARLRITAFAPLRAIDLHVGGRTSPIGKLAWQAGDDGIGGVLILTDADDIARFVAAARDAATISAGPGVDAPRVSLAGLSASLLFIDEAQGRLDTTTALLKAGSRPAASVPAAPAPPTLPPAYAPVPADLDDAAGDRLAANVRRQQAHSLRQAGCDAGDGIGDQDRAIALTASEALVFLTCHGGAYQSESLVFRTPRGGNAAASRVRLPALPFAAGNDGKPFDTLVGADYDPATATLASLDRARGPGDCGESATWRFDGTAFQLTDYRVLDRCGGARPDDWPVLWRTAGDG